jgi:hypothetical protein
VVFFNSHVPACAGEEGEAHAIRQMLGHTDLPQFVGDMSEALYRPEE